MINEATGGGRRGLEWAAEREGISDSEYLNEFALFAIKSKLEFSTNFIANWHKRRTKSKKNESGEKSHSFSLLQ